MGIVSESETEVSFEGADKSVCGVLSSDAETYGGASSCGICVSDSVSDVVDRAVCVFFL